MKNLILNFLWFKKIIGVSLDQKVDSTLIPLTEYFFWPRTDSWEEMEKFLTTKKWISSVNTVLLLNTITEVINYWQDENNKEVDIEEVRKIFSGSTFI